MAPNILFQVAPKKPDGTTETLWMSHASADSSGTQLDDKEWKPLITKRPTISLELMDNAGNQSSSVVKRGAIEFRLSRGYRNSAWANYTWADAPAKMWVGELGQPFSAYVQILDGTVSTLSVEKGLASVELLGPDGDLDIDLLSKAYAGTGGAEGPKEMEGALKPWCSGTVKNISPVLVDPARYIYQVHGYGPVADITNVYDIQALDQDRKTVVQTYLELVDLEMTPGDWAVCLPLGMVRIGGSVKAGLQADVIGATFAGTAPTSIAAIVPHLLSLAGFPPTKVGDFSQFASCQWGAYYDSQENLGDVIRDAMTQAGGYIVADGAGVWQCGDFYAPKAPTLLKSDRTSLPLVRTETVKEANAANPAWQVSVGYDRCWTVLDDIATSPTLNNAITTVNEALPTILDGLENVTELANQVDTINDTIDGYAEDNERTALAVDNQAWATVENAINLFNETTTRIATTQVDGADIGPLFRAERTRTDNLFSQFELIGEVTPDGSAIITNLNTFKWDATTTWAQKIAQISATTGDATAAIEEERDARTTADQAEAEARTQLEASVNGNISQTLTSSKAYTDQLRTYTTNTFATLSAFNANKSQVQTSINTLTTDLAAEATARIALGTLVGNNQSWAVSQIGTLTTNQSSETQARLELASLVGQNKASADSTLSTLTTTTQSHAGLLTGLRTDVNGNKALFQNDIQTLSNNLGAQVSRIDTLVAQMAGTDTTAYLVNRANLAVSKAQAAIDTLGQMGVTVGNGGAMRYAYSSVYAADGTSLVTDLSTMKATLGQKTDKGYVDAQITLTSQAAANANNTTAEIANGLSTTLNGHTSRIDTLQSSVNGLNAKYMVSVIAGQYWGGIELGASSTGGSEIKMLADRFGVYTTAGAGGKPFSVDSSGIYLNSNVSVNGNLIVSGTIDTQGIRVGAVSTIVANSGNYNGGYGNGGSTAQVTSVTVNCTGKPVLVWGQYTAMLTSGPGYINATGILTRNGGTIVNAASYGLKNFYYTLPFMIVDNPGPGVHTYRIHDTVGTGAYTQFHAYGLSATEIKV